MRTVSRTLALLLALSPAVTLAGMNRTFLVPAHRPCPGAQTTCAPQPRASSYTFEQAVLRSPQKPFTGPNQLALLVELKGVRDGAGNLVTTDRNDPADDFVFRVPPGRVVLLAGTPIQLEPGSAFSVPTEVRLDLENGKGRQPLRTPPETPTSGLVNQTLELPVIYDPAGNPFAVSGARSRP